MDNIKKWIEEKGNFTDGYALLEGRCRNRHMLHVILRREDIERLTYELEKIVRIHEPPKRISPTHTSKRETKSSSENRLKIIRDGRVSINDLPGPIRKTYDIASEAYSRAKSLHARMKAVNTDEERAEARAELCSAEEKRKKAWSIIDRWGESGELPIDAKAQAEINSPPDYKEVQAAATYLSRNIKDLDKLTDEKELESLKTVLAEKVAILQNVGRTFKGRHNDILARHGMLN